MNLEEIKHAIETWDEPGNEARIRFEKLVEKMKKDPEYIKQQEDIEALTRITEADLSIRMTI